MKHLCALLPLSLALASGCASSSTLTHGVPNLAVVDAERGIYRGGEPTAEGWVYLSQAMAVSNYVNLHTGSESGVIDPNNKPALAARDNMRAFWHPIPLSQQLGLAPLDLANIEGAVSDIDVAPGMYIHCAHGQDRTGLVVALYRLRHGWSKADAEKEMLAHGFHKMLRGLWEYWEKANP